MMKALAVLVLGAFAVSAEEYASATAYAKAAEQHFRTGDYKTSATLWKKALRRDASNPEFLDGLGRAYERQAEASSFPLMLNGKARRSFARALAIDPGNGAALVDLIELEQIPVGLCEGDLTRTSLLIDRLQTIDPVAAHREREYWLDATNESKRPGQMAMCGPVKVARALTGRLSPPVVVSASIPAADQSLKLAEVTR